MAKVYLSGRMTSDGLITLPIDLINHLQISEGDRLKFIVSESGDVEFSGIIKNEVTEE